MASANSIQIALLRIQMIQLEERKALLEYYIGQAEEPRLVWCVDLSDNITVGSIVGTIEVDRELQGLNIKPSFDDSSAYVAADDGILRYFGTMNPYMQLLNDLIAPGVELFHPRFRYGEIYDINTEKHTASVNLRPYTSDLNTSIYLNQVDNLYGVKIDYMDCDSAAFDEGDIVVVDFDDNKWGQGTVKGFKDNPQPCNDEVVYVKLGPLGILWDVKSNDYVEDYEGTQQYTDCELYVVSRTETTITVRLGLPYKKLLNTYYMEADYSDFREKVTTWGLPEQDEDPGYVYDKLRISYERVDTDVDFTITAVWDDTVTPWGILNDGYTFFMLRSPGFGLVSEYGVYSFSTYDYVYSAYICPLDTDFANFSYGTAAEYGNDLPATGYQGLKMSEKTYVQVIFSCNAPYTYDVYAVPQWEYTGPRETICHCTCSTYPFEIGEAPEDDPQALPINAEFSAAIHTMIEDLHTLWGVTILKDYPGYVESYSCDDESGDISAQCAAGECDYWWTVLYPDLSVKIYRK